MFLKQAAVLVFLPNMLVSCFRYETFEAFQIREKLLYSASNFSSLALKSQFNISLSDIPDEIDWTKFGFVSPVKNQGDCISGAVFAAAGAMEGQQKSIFGSLVPLSTQQIHECCGRGSCKGCVKGDFTPTEYLECVADLDGLDSERCYPFTGKCNECRLFPKCISVGVIGYNVIEAGNEEALANAVALVGPIATSIHASRSSFRSFRGRGVYSDPACSKNSPDHSVLIVGYGFEGSTPYWLIKNSWGESWGHQGYAKVIRRKNMCGIANQAVYPIIVNQAK